MRGPLRCSLLLAGLAIGAPASAPLVAGGASAQGTQPTIDEVVARMSRYVAGYGEHASLIVAVEKYSQNVSTVSSGPLRQRRLTAEFAIVRAEGAVGWVGFRDVVEVDGKKITDQPERLRQLFLESSFNPAAVLAISNESARYNFGPAIRNFNVPTTALFFFHPANVARFTFTKRGTRKIGSIEAWEIAFVEVRKPTLIMKRDGTDVPCEGSVWVAPDDGTVLRTRLQLQHFADRTDEETESRADIDVTYVRDPDLALWLPSRMTEMYEVPYTLRLVAPLPAEQVSRSGARPPSLARVVTEAIYSEFRQFQTSAKIVFPK